MQSNPPGGGGGWGTGTGLHGPRWSVPLPEAGYLQVMNVCVHLPARHQVVPSTASVNDVMSRFKSVTCNALAVLDPSTDKAVG